ncbi:hypothetical protein NQ314_003169 [Rhamnusium bicolor]|uniref:HTH CENPB-type domain-containing protein n=1 Tax=Rhamnusium bicolor TaxID=1586634 RepID=A0AAV8ZQC9_9CUCU|nr:hypothetical protein NQ314_003169 [Rhamnusium bicolor]
MKLRTGVRIANFKDNLPGRDWLQSFLNRHKIQLVIRMPQSIKESTAIINHATINSYFDHLEKTLDNIHSESIVNYDETNFTDDPGRKMEIVRKNSKRAKKIMESSKAATSVMFTCSASGVLLPPRRRRILCTRQTTCEAYGLNMAQTRQGIIEVLLGGLT